MARQRSDQERKAMFSNMNKSPSRDSGSIQFVNPPKKIVTLRIPFETEKKDVLVTKDKKVKVPGTISISLDKPREGSIEIQGFKKNPDKFGFSRPNFFTKKVSFSKDAVEDETRLLIGKRVVARAP